MKKGDIMAGLDGYSSAWSLGLFIGGARDNSNKKEEKEVHTSPYEQAMKQERERKIRIKENPEERKYIEKEIAYLKRSIENMKMELKHLEAEYRRRMAQSRRCFNEPCTLTYEYSERCERISSRIWHSECVLHSKEKLLHDALNM